MFPKSTNPSKLLSLSIFIFYKPSFDSPKIDINSAFVFKLLFVKLSSLLWVVESNSL